MNNLFWQFSVDERTELVHNIPVIHSIKQNDLQNKIKTATVKKATLWMLRFKKTTSENLQKQMLNRINWFPELYTHVQDKTCQYGETPCWGLSTDSGTGFEKASEFLVWSSSSAES